MAGSESDSHGDLVLVVLDRYDHHADLDRARAAAEEAAAELARLGFGRIEHDLAGADGSHAQVSAGIQAWAPQRSPSVFYWTGHGQRLQLNGLHLLCRDTPAPFRSTGFETAIPAASLGAAIAHKRISQAVVLIDACHAGGGALEIIEGYNTALAELDGQDTQAMEIAVITSASHEERAAEGVFPNALRRAVHAQFNPRWQRISARDLAKAIQAAYTEANVTGQRVAIQEAGVGAPDAQKVFRNPAYRPYLPPMQMGLREGAERRIEDDLEDHFLLKFRGLEVLGDQGWFFSGRKQTLGRIGKFLEHPGPGVFVLTGPPGSGKSAVLGRLAVLSNPRTREQARQAGVLDDDEAGGDSGTPWPDRPISGGLHARGLTFAACVAGLARALGGDAADVRGLAEDIAGRTVRGERVTLMLDALDEAQPSDILRIVTDLLRPAVGAGAKILVGTRRSAVREGEWPKVGTLLERLTGEAYFQEWDLDKDTAGQADVAAYIANRLLTAPSSPYRKEAEKDPEKAGQAARTAAAILAERCGGVFLPARVYCHVLIRRPVMPDLTQAQNLKLFSPDLKEAFDADLRRFGPQEQWVRNRLRTLTWAEGNGLPAAGVWPAVAEALLTAEPGTASPTEGPPLSVDDAEIEQLIATAAPYLIEATESGQPVYRLYHEEFIKYLRGDDDPIERQTRITLALLDLAGPEDRRSWERVNPYLIRHLPAHAAEAGLLAELLADPAFLVHADPDRIAAMIKQTEFDFDERPLARLYHRLADRMPALEPAQRAELLQTGAGQYEPEALTGLRDLPGLLWSGITSIAESQPFYRSFEGHTEPVTELAVVPIGGQPLLVTGSRSILHLWDLKAGSRRQTVTRPRALEGRAVVGPHHGEPVLAVAVGGRIRMLGLDSGEEHPARDFPGPVSAMALHRAQDGRSLLAVASPTVAGPAAAGHTLVTVLDLESGALVGAPCAKAVERLAWTDLGGEPVLAGAGGGDVWLWPPTGMAQPYNIHTSSQPIWSMAVCTRGSRVLCAWSRNNGDIEVTTAVRVVGGGGSDPDVGVSGSIPTILVALPGVPAVASAAAGAAGRRGGTGAGGDGSGTGSMWHTDEVRQFTGHRQAVRALAFAGIDGRQVLVSGSDDRTARLWDIATGEHRVLQSAHHVDTVAAAVLDGRIVVATGDRGAGVRLWNPAPDPHTGAGPTPASRDTAASTVRAVAVASYTGSLAGFGPDPDPDDDITIIFGTRDGEVQVRHGDGTLLRSWTRGSGEVVAVATDGRRAAAGHKDGTIEIYDRGTGQRRDQPGAHQGRVEALVFLPDGSLVSSGTDGAVRLWRAYGRVMLTGSAPVPFRALAAALTPEGPRLAAVARNRIRIWDLLGTVKEPQGIDLRLPDGAGPLRSAALAALDGGTTLAVGDTDGGIYLLPVPGRAGTLADRPRSPTVFHGHTGVVHALAMGTVQGQSILVSAATDRTVRMWDPDRGEELDRWSAEASADELTAAGFHPAGNRMLRVLGIGRAVHVADARRAGPDPEPWRGPAVR